MDLSFPKGCVYNLIIMPFKLANKQKKSGSGFCFLWALKRENKVYFPVLMLKWVIRKDRKPKRKTNFCFFPPDLRK